MGNPSRLATFAFLAFVGALAALPASADGLRFGGDNHGRSPVIGFIGCDMHAADGPEVMLVQFARTPSRTDPGPGRLIGMRCADALLLVQKRGLRLGQSRVVPAQASGGIDCLAWDIVGQN